VQNPLLLSGSSSNKPLYQVSFLSFTPGHSTMYSQSVSRIALNSISIFIEEDPYLSVNS
jgi:hypothetical protein